MELVDFLYARLEEDQVKRVTMREWHAEDCDHLPQMGFEYTFPCDCGVPERVGREVEAKRRIINLRPAGLAPVQPRTVADWVYDQTLRLLAQPYSDHPDFDQRWAV